MNLLILGGTRFVGRHLTEAALHAGHDVTLFNRKRSGAATFPETETLIGDRDSDVSALRGRSWDAVIDTSAYTPTAARLTAELLRDAASHYTFISTVSVYRSFAAPEVNEEAPVGILSDEETQAAERSKSVPPEAYGPLKARCEKIVAVLFADHALIVRPGLVVGPHDYTDRFTYWARRIGRVGHGLGNEVLSPGDPESRVQFIDGRDLARWVVEATERGLTGTFNATGPAEPLSMEKLLTTARRTLNPEADLVWVGDDFLLAHSLSPSDLYPWLPLGTLPDWRGFYAIDARRAIAEGLSFRPLEETLRDTLVWDETRGGVELRAGLSPEHEKELLEGWHAVR